MNILVYKVECPNNRHYIGITKQSLNERRLKHSNAAKNGSRFKFHKAIKKYGDLLIWEVLETVHSWELAQEREKFYIQEFDSFKKGFNSTLGGEGQLGNTPMLGKRHSLETLKKMSLAKLGKPKTERMKRKISKLHKGRKHTKEHIEKCLLSRGLKPFEVLDSTSNIVGVFNNQSDCSRKLNLSQVMIAHCLRRPKVYKSHKGFRFRYKD